jgi:hypothetical protein
MKLHGGDEFFVFSARACGECWDGLLLLLLPPAAAACCCRLLLLLLPPPPLLLPPLLFGACTRDMHSP